MLTVNIDIVLLWHCYLYSAVVAMFCFMYSFVSDYMSDLAARNRGESSRKLRVPDTIEGLLVVLTPLLNTIMVISYVMAAYEAFRSWLNVHGDIAFVGEKRVMDLPVSISGANVPVLVPGTPIRIHQDDVETKKTFGKTFKRRGYGICQIIAHTSTADGIPKIDTFVIVSVSPNDPSLHDELLGHAQSAVDLLKDKPAALWASLPDAFNLGDVKAIIKASETPAAPPAPTDTTKGSADDL